MRPRNLLPPSLFIRIGIPILGLGLGLTEAAFIFTARQALGGRSAAILFWLAILVLLRFVFQDRIAVLETRAMQETISNLRQKLWSVLRSNAVPVYRAEFKRNLVATLEEIIPRMGEGFLAYKRCVAALLQALILIPCLFFISWRLALMSLVLVIPAWLATRWRSRSLRTLERAEVRGRTEGKRTIENFGENLESTSGGAGLKFSTEVLEQELKTSQTPEWKWRTAQARYPAILEVGFFFALAILVWIGGSSLGPWESWILFSGLLLLAYRPVREAARHYPTALQGTQALHDFENVLKEWESFPTRTLPAIYPEKNLEKEKFALDKIDFGYVEKKTEQKVFRNFSIEFDPNGVTGIMGPNGAGKTTLLRLLANVETPLHGNVYWTESARTFGSIAYLPQRVSLGSNWIQWAQDLKTNNPERWRELNALLRIDRLLMKGELDGHSGGEKQRIALARILCSDAPNLLMDEPTTALPGDEREEILKGVIGLWASPLWGHGGTRGVVIVSHESFLNRICDTIVSLDSEGKYEIFLKSSPVPLV